MFFTHTNRPWVTAGLQLESSSWISPCTPEWDCQTGLEWLEEQKGTEDHQPWSLSFVMAKSFLDPYWKKKKTFFKIIFSCFLRDGEGGRKGEKHQCVRDTSMGCFSHAPNRGCGPQPRHVPWLRIEPPIFQFEGWCPTHWATPLRVPLKKIFMNL